MVQNRRVGDNLESYHPYFFQTGTELWILYTLPYSHTVPNKQDLTVLKSAWFTFTCYSTKLQHIQFLKIPFWFPCPLFVWFVWGMRYEVWGALGPLAYPWWLDSMNRDWMQRCRRVSPPRGACYALVTAHWSHVVWPHPDTGFRRGPRGSNIIAQPVSRHSNSYSAGIACDHGKL